jgi:hypothetical protein
MKLLTWGLVLSAVTTSAHHSLEGSFDLKKEVRLEGKIRQILLRNPHSFMQIEMPDQDGKAQIWTLEFPKGAKALLKQGIQPGTLKVGDQVTITMNPSFKPADKRGNMVTLYRASDGFEWSAKLKPKHR